MRVSEPRTPGDAGRAQPRFATRAVGCRKLALGETQGRGIARGPRRNLRVGNRGPERAAIDRRPHRFLRPVVEQHECRAVFAREATDEERERLWPMVVDTYADFAVYQARTERKIPVVILTPAD